MKSSPRKLRPVHLKSGQIDSDRRLLVPRAAMTEIELPALILLKGSRRSRVVRGIREGGGPENRTIATASSALCDRITPGSVPKLDFEAEYVPARLRDVVKDLGLAGFALVVAAIVICVGCIAGAVATFLNSKLGFGLAFSLFAAVVFGAMATAAINIRNALRIP